MTNSTVKRTLRAVCIATILLGFASPVTAAAPMDMGKAFTKLTRGAVNVLTGWVEIPKRILETSQASGPATGFTWGTLRGFGYGFVRTAGGVYEVVTFPFPAPSDYAPVIDPEYVFTNEFAASDPYEY